MADIFLVIPDDGTLVVWFMRIADEAKNQLLEQGTHPSELKEQIEFHGVVGSVRKPADLETIASKFEECRRTVSEASQNPESELCKAVREHSFQKYTNGYAFRQGEKAIPL